MQIKRLTVIRQAGPICAAEERLVDEVATWRGAGLQQIDGHRAAASRRLLTAVDQRGFGQAPDVW